MIWYGVPFERDTFAYYSLSDCGCDSLPKGSVLAVVAAQVLIFLQQVALFPGGFSISGVSLDFYYPGTYWDFAIDDRSAKLSRIRSEGTDSIVCPQAESVSSNTSDDAWGANLRGHQDNSRAGSPVVGSLSVRDADSSCR